MKDREVNYLFESPVGYVECLIREDRTILYSRPSLVINETQLDASRLKHPQLARAFMSISKAPSGYNLLSPQPSWAPNFWAQLSCIPFGTTLSYAQFADQLGLGREYARVIGSQLATNNYFLLLPCHRIIKADGSPGGFKWGIEKKIELLTCENYGKAS